MKQYEHTQTGYLLITAIGAAIIFIIALLITTGFNWVGLAVLVLLAVSLFLFSRLNVQIAEDILEVRFGPGFIHKKFYLKDIESSRIVKNHWYYGWGVRVTPHGPLYNVSGFQAVELQLKTGAKFRIGTDVPQELQEAISRTISAKKKQK